MALQVLIVLMLLMKPFQYVNTAPHCTNNLSTDNEKDVLADIIDRLTKYIDLKIRSSINSIMSNFYKKCASNINEAEEKSGICSCVKVICNEGNSSVKVNTTKSTESQMEFTEHRGSDETTETSTYITTLHASADEWIGMAMDTDQFNNAIWYVPKESNLDCKISSTQQINTTEITTTYLVTEDEEKNIITTTEGLSVDGIYVTLTNTNSDISPLEDHNFDNDITTDAIDTVSSSEDNGNIFETATRHYKITDYSSSYSPLNNKVNFAYETIRSNFKTTTDYVSEADITLGTTFVETKKSEYKINSFESIPTGDCTERVIIVASDINNIDITNTAVIKQDNTNEGSELSGLGNATIKTEFKTTQFDICTSRNIRYDVTKTEELGSTTREDAKETGNAIIIEKYTTPPLPHLDIEATNTYSTEIALDTYATDITTINVMGDGIEDELKSTKLTGNQADIEAEIILKESISRNQKNQNEIITNFPIITGMSIVESNTESTVTISGTKYQTGDITEVYETTQKNNLELVDQLIETCEDNRNTTTTSFVISEECHSPITLVTEEYEGQNMDFTESTRFWINGISSNTQLATLNTTNIYPNHSGTSRQIAEVESESMSGASAANDKDSTIGLEEHNGNNVYATINPTVFMEQEAKAPSARMKSIQDPYSLDGNENMENEISTYSNIEIRQQCMEKEKLKQNEIYIYDNLEAGVEELYVPIIKISRKNNTFEFTEHVKSLFA